MGIDGKFLGEEQCENVKEVVSKFGVTVVCDEKEEERLHADVILPASEQCENMKTVASKVGVTVVCDEEA
jgi:bifunctional pyridoxal-dependent enzyme with beta-cystathionase and maltose regulon repressor activities